MNNRQNILKNNAILAIDPSLSSTGIALYTNNIKGIPLSIPECLRLQTSLEDGATDKRIMKICNELDNIAYSYSVRYVAFEEGFVGVSAKTSLQLAELRGALCYMFNSHGYDVHYMQPSEIRKNFGLKGNAKKEDVAKKILEIYSDLENIIGPYSDKNNKNKTSDMYDAASIGLAFKYKYDSGQIL